MAVIQWEKSNLGDGLEFGRVHGRICFLLSLVFHGPSATIYSIAADDGSEQGKGWVEKLRGYPKEMLMQQAEELVPELIQLAHAGDE